jgi:hypothetical protein
MDTEIKRLIPAQRCTVEGLDFIEERTVDDQDVTHVDYKIIDAAGIVYNAMLQSDGTVFDGYMTYADTKTFEAIQGPVNTLCGWWWAHWRYEILRDQNGEIYLWQRHKNVGDAGFMRHIASANELAEILFDLQEQEILEFTTGHWGVCLPAEIRDELITTAYHSGEKSRQEMIVERLRRPPLTEDQKRELLRARTPQPSDARKGQVASLLEKIRQRQAAAKQPNIEEERSSKATA